MEPELAARAAPTAAALEEQQQRPDERSVECALPGVQGAVRYEERYIGAYLACRVFAEASERRVSPSNPPVVVYVHPWAVMGGAQEMLLRRAALLAREQCLRVVTVDLRGAGGSRGATASLRGGPEVEDVRAVLALARQRFPASEVYLAGESAGGPIAGSALAPAVDALGGEDGDVHVAGFIACGYTWGFWTRILFGRHFSALLKAKRTPRCFIMGERDCFTSVRTLNKRARQCAEADTNAEGAVANVEVQIVAAAGHFELEGPPFDTEVARRIGEFVWRVHKGEFPAATSARKAEEGLSSDAAATKSAPGEQAEDEDDDSMREVDGVGEIPSRA